MEQGRVIERWIPPHDYSNATWEAAYARFETPEEEIAKFVGRLRRFGAEQWSRDAQVVEIFCGRGGGLEAWRSLGFSQLEGVDISEALLRRYQGRAKLYVGDCRQLHFPVASRDIVCVQGGLHHLPVLPGDLEQTVKEVQRVLRPGGRFVVVEPWATPFLHAVHAVAARPWMCRASAKLEALACMIEHERDTYCNWLGRPREILAILGAHFAVEKQHIGWGKLLWCGRKRG